MSFKITIYCDDSTISKTKAYVSNIQQTFTADYNGTYINSQGGYTQGVYTASGISGTVKFTAEPATGCEFQYWEYWIGSTSTTTKNSTATTFTYTGGDDIYIRAVGKYGKVETDWSANSSFALDLIDETKQSADIFDYRNNKYGLFPKTIHSGRVSFTRSGYAHFYTTGNVDTLGYLSDSPSWKADYSGPRSYLESDDDSYDGHNFDISYYVSPDTDYYLFVRGSSGTEQGEVTVHVTEPWEFNEGSHGCLTSSVEGREIVHPFTLYRREVSFSKSGKLAINAGSGCAVGMWLSTSPEWYYNVPVYPLTDGYLNAEAKNPTLEWDVEAGETYYLWFRNDSDYSSYLLYVICDIEEEEHPAVKKWDWNKSNGSASDGETYDSFWAAEFKGATTDFSHKVWNDMCSKVKSIREAIGEVWNEYYATYEETRMTTPGADGYYELTAKMFNSLRYNIGSTYVGGSGVQEVKAGDDVKGLYFTRLASRMNDWIDSL